MRAAIVLILFPLLLLTWVQPLTAQAARLSQGLEAAFRYPCFSDFLILDEANEPRISGILANNQVPSDLRLELDSRLIQISPGQRTQERYWIRLDRVRMKEKRAKVSFLYDQTIKARIWLEWEEDHWLVKRSLVRERLRGRRGKAGRRFCFSF
jgi:hypothetical protein